jgi:H+/Cl- antiporter ClcA
MGVAAAFGAPVGGILFSLEEASSYWSKSLTWRAFFGTMIAAVLAKLVKSGFTSVNAAGFIEFPDRNASFELWELILFAILGVITGLLGALFCGIVKRTAMKRRQVFKLGNPTSTTRKARVVEVLCVVTLTMTVCFWIPTAFGCTKLPHTHRLSEEQGELPDISGGICLKGTYSGIGYLLLQKKEAAIKKLFSRTMQGGAVLTISDLLWSYAII